MQASDADVIGPIYILLIYVGHFLSLVLVGHIMVDQCQNVMDRNQ